MPGDDSDPRNEWLRYSGLTEDQKVLLRRHGRVYSSPPVFGAILLIAMGVLLFLNSLGWLPVRHIWDFWPLVFVWIGIGRFLGARNTAERALGIVFVCGGSLVLLFTLHILTIRARDGTWPLALLLILFGAALLMKALQRPVRSPIGFQVTDRGAYSANLLNDSTFLGAITRKFDTPNFQGGSVSNFMGSVEIDLRRAQIGTSTRSAEVDVRVLLGAVKMRIPETWRIHLNGSSILGVFEDKTVPPNTGQDAPVLVVTGYSAFSTVEIEN
jgi:predicted membrane protein